MKSKSEQLAEIYARHGRNCRLCNRYPITETGYCDVCGIFQRERRKAFWFFVAALVAVHSALAVAYWYFRIR